MIWYGLRAEVLCCSFFFCGLIWFIGLKLCSNAVFAGLQSRDEKKLKKPAIANVVKLCPDPIRVHTHTHIGVQQLGVVPPPSVSKAEGMAPVNVPGYDNYNRPHCFMTTHVDDMRHFSNMTWLHEDVCFPAFKKRFKITHCDKALNLAGVLPTEHLKLRWTHSTGEAKADS